jgi:hypothetical protein
LDFIATVGGGWYNIASGYISTVGGGEGNRALGAWSTVAGGRTNTSSAESSTIGGGDNNRSADSWAVVAGGYGNSASGQGTTVAGGENNAASGLSAAVGGGFLNQAANTSSTVPGGEKNLAGGAGSFAAGRSAKATNDGAFVWSGVDAVDTTSTNSDSFTVRAPGGVRFISTLADSSSVTNGPYNSNNSTGLTNGVYLAPNSGAWASLSDSNAKTKVTAIKPREILSKLVAMPLKEWEYKVDPNRRYIGPMAQDFHSTFGLGADDKTISTLDSDGVMYAAIQGLVEEIELRDEKIAQLEARSVEQGAASTAEITALKVELRALSEEVRGLPRAP